MDPRDQPISNLERIEEAFDNMDPDPLGNYVNTAGPLDPERDMGSCQYED